MERPLRLAFVVPGFCADDRDWCIPALRNLVLYLAARHEIVIYSPHYPYRRSVYHACGATVHCFSNRKEQGVRRIMLWREVVGRIVADHRERPFDLVHAFWATEPGFLASHAARRAGVPLVVSIGGGELARFPVQRYGSQLSPVQRFFVRTSFRRASVITAGSRWVAAKVEGEVARKLRQAPFGVDTEMFTPSAPPMGERLAVSASMIALKDYPTLLRAVAIARRSLPGLTLDVAGDGVERPTVERMIAELGIADAVTLRGNLPHDDMPAFYRSADCLVHASLYESQGMAILEALASGRPVVATNVGVAAEMPGSLVRTVPPADAAAMAGAIVETLTRWDRAAVAAEARACIESDYCLARCCARVEAIYDEQIHGRPLR